MSARKLREKARISYYEPEEPSLDEYLFCERCSDYVYEYCAIHGPLLVIPDDKIYDRNNKRSHVVDAADANRSNWMRYVNCSRHWREQNLVAYQYKGQLYYRTIKIIPRFTELLVFYGSEFANILRVNLGTYNAPKSYARKFGASEPKKPPQKTKSYVEKISLDNPKKSGKAKNKQEPTTISKIGYEDSPVDKCNNNNLIQDSNELDKNDISSYHESKKEIPRNKIQVKQNITNIADIKKNEQTNQTPDNIVKKIKLRCHEKEEKTINFSNPQNAVKDFSQRNNINFNNNENITNKEYLCDICCKSFSTQNYLENHILCVHSNMTPNQCNICKKRFTKSYLDIHIRTHTGEKPYQCNICKKRFTKSYLGRHIRTHTGEEPYQCNICKKSFSTKSNLGRHIRTHTGEKPYQCNICKKSFNQKPSLDTHIRTHTGEKPYQCNICKKSFSEKSSLVKHIRTHTGEKPYQCNICKKSFSEKSNLVKHIRTHTGEKPYQCSICKKSFNQKPSLDTHIRTHTGEKPYQCNICKKSFNQKPNLDTHIRTHTGEKPYQCDICKKSFSEKSSLVKHIRTHWRETLSV